MNSIANKNLADSMSLNKSMVVVLENVRSVHNVGSIFRTADAVGVLTIYLCGITPTPLTPFGKKRSDFHKVALGAEDSVTFEYAASAYRLLKKLKERGYRTVAVEQADNSIPYYKFRPKKSDMEQTALVLGNEPKGLSKRLLELCDMILEIPMLGKKESLNVSVAFGIVAYHLTVIGSSFSSVSK